MDQTEKFNQRSPHLRKGTPSSQTADNIGQPTAKTSQPKTVATAAKPEDNSVCPTEEAEPKRPSTQRYNHALPSNIAEAINDYIYAKTDDYSDEVVDFTEAKGLSQKVKTSHALDMLDHLRDEFRKRPDKSQPNPPKINRVNLMRMALTIHDSNPKSQQVDKKLKNLFGLISRVAQNDYAKRIQKNANRGNTDSFVNNLIALRNPDNAEYLSEIIEKHINGMFDKLEKQNDKLRYARLLRKLTLNDFVPEDLAAELDKPKPQNSDKPKHQSNEEPNQGDKPMTDEIKDETSAPADNEATEEEKKLKKQEDIKKFEASDVQKKACGYAGLNPEEFENAEKLNDALLSAGVIVKGEQILIKDGSEAAKNAEEQNKDKEDKDYNTVSSDEFDKAKEDMLRDKNAEKPALTADVLDKEETNEPQVDRTWIEKKIENYKAMETANKIGKIEITQGLQPEDKEFEVNVDGGTVHYSSPDNVSISSDAQIKTFEAVLMEDENIGRPISFSENMPHDMAVRLAAACVLHGNKMIGAKPELTPEDMQLLQSELGERFEEFNKKLQEMNNPEEKKNDKTDEGKGDEKTEKPAEEKAKISTTEELGKAVESLKDIKEKFEQMKTDGLIAVTTNLETKKPEIVAGPALDGKPEEEQKKVVNSANALIASAAAIVQSSKTVGGKLNEEQAEQNNEFNQERMAHIRNNMDQKKLAEHEAKVDNVALIHAKRMGLKEVENIEVKDHKGNVVETIKDDKARTEYGNKLSETTKARMAQVLKNKGNDGK